MRAMIAILLAVTLAGTRTGEASDVRVSEPPPESVLAKAGISLEPAAIASALEHPRSKIAVRRAAAAIIGARQMREGIRALRSAISSDPIDSVRVAAAISLYQVGDRPAAIVALEQEIHRAASAGQMCRIAMSLAAMGSMRGFKEVAGLVDSSDRFDRALALRAVAAYARVNPQQALGVLRRGLRDREALIRIGTIERIAEIGGEQAKASLRGMENDPDEEVRRTVRRVCRECAAPTNKPGK